MKNNLPLYLLNCEYFCDSFSSFFEGSIYRKGEIIFGSAFEKGIRKSIFGKIYLEEDISRLSFLTFEPGIEYLSLYVFPIESKNRLSLNGSYEGQNWQYMDPYALESNSFEEELFLSELVNNPESNKLVDLLDVARRKNSLENKSEHFENEFLDYLTRTTIAFVEGSLNNKSILELNSVFRNRL
ncbi:MAG: hypothetical protein PF569_10255 [Candidatus Woesearchaeota archaeon]|jgi:hypothetical protein|nr:hypothetical protein [Candidatus Woesearchaeota archaeon]